MTNCQACRKACAYALKDRIRDFCSCTRLEIQLKQQILNFSICGYFERSVVRRTNIGYPNKFQITNSKVFPSFHRLRVSYKMVLKNYVDSGLVGQIQKNIFVISSFCDRFILFNSVSRVIKQITIIWPVFCCSQKRKCQLRLFWQITVSGSVQLDWQSWQSKSCWFDARTRRFNVSEKHFQILFFPRRIPNHTSPTDLKIFACGCGRPTFVLQTINVGVARQKRPCLENKHRVLLGCNRIAVLF